MKVAVLYNVPVRESARKENEIVAELEILETVDGVKKALERLGHEAIPLRCSFDAIPALLKCDAVFNLAESFGNNIRAEPYVAGILEISDLPYTGSSPDVMEICRNKYLAKVLLERDCILTPRYQLLRNADSTLSLDFPVIVKPSLEDASIGITSDSLARNEEELRKSVQRIIETYSQPALVEEYIDGREINASILRTGKHVEVLPLSEIVFTLPDGVPKIVSFEAKWIKDSIHYQNTIPRCPTELEPAFYEKIRRLALEACNSLGVEEYARVDFRVRGNEVFVLEVNPNPCINPNGSGFVRSAKAAGLSFSQVVKIILNSAFKRGKCPKKQDSNHVSFCFNFENLRFKQIKTIDAPILAKWFGDYEATKYMDPSTLSEEDLLISILTSADKDFLVYHGDAAIGFASIYSVKKCMGEVSFLIGKMEFRGRGLGKSILRGLAEYGFNAMGLRSLFASATVENIPAIKSLEWAGFRRIGVRKAYQDAGEMCFDEILFDLTKEDYSLND